MREPGVELCDLSGSHGDVVVGEDQTHLPTEHVEPFVALVRTEFGFLAFGWDDHFPGVRSTRLLGQGDSSVRVTPHWVRTRLRRGPTSASTSVIARGVSMGPVNSVHRCGRREFPETATEVGKFVSAAHSDNGGHKL